MMLRPDSNLADYARFYDEIGAAQLEEQYMARHSYAVARFHLVLDCLLGVTGGRGTLLDIGCASGYYSVAFAKAGGLVAGIDISDASIELARRRAKQEAVADRCDFRTGDMRRLPFAEGSFDAVLMVEVLEHVREQRQAVGEALRVLRPGGELVLTTPHAFDKLSRWQRFRHRNAVTPESAGIDVERLGINPFIAEAGIGHEPYFHDAFTFEQLRALVGDGGVIVTLHSLYIPAPGARLMSHAPPRLRRRLKRLLAWRGSTSTTEEQPANHSAEGPMAIPPLDTSAALMVRASKVMWRIPGIRMTSYHNLLVARRR
jgi:ubiquinone/menaquinone biosynthesis C-methylase UbiE